MDGEPSDRIEQKKTLLNKALAAEEKIQKMLIDEIAKYEAELKQLEGAEPIPLPSPGNIYYLLTILFSLFLLFLFLKRCVTAWLSILLL